MPISYHERLRIPKNTFKLISNIYSYSNTIFTEKYFGQTKEIPLQRGTIQENTLSPYLFIIFLGPLLGWLQKEYYDYTFGTSKSTSSFVAYTDNLATITNKLKSLQS